MPRSTSIRRPPAGPSRQFGARFCRSCSRRPARSTASSPSDGDAPRRSLRTSPVEARSNQEPRADRGSDFVQSLERGLAVIRAFDGSASLTLSEVATASGLTRAAARRFLLTLAELGYVRRGGARVSPDAHTCSSSGVRTSRTLTVPEIALPHLRNLVGGRRASPRRWPCSIASRSSTSPTCRPTACSRSRSPSGGATRRLRRRSGACSSPPRATSGSTTTWRMCSSSPYTPRTIVDAGAPAGRARPDPPPGLRLRRPGARGGPARRRRAAARRRGASRRGRERRAPREPLVDRRDPRHARAARARDGGRDRRRPRRRRASSRTI